MVKSGIFLCDAWTNMSTFTVIPVFGIRFGPWGDGGGGGKVERRVAEVNIDFANSNKKENLGKKCRFVKYKID